MNDNYQKNQRRYQLYRDQWINDQLKERGWSKKKIKRGERYRNSEKYIIVGLVWIVFILSAPLGLPLCIYGGYLRFRYADFGEEYVTVRRELKREFSRQKTVDDVPAAWSAGEIRWRDRLPLTQ